MAQLRLGIQHALYMIAGRGHTSDIHAKMNSSDKHSLGTIEVDECYLSRRLGVDNVE